MDTKNKISDFRKFFELMAQVIDGFQDVARVNDFLFVTSSIDKQITEQYDKKNSP